MAVFVAHKERRYILQQAAKDSAEPGTLPAAHGAVNEVSSRAPAP